MPKTYLTTPYLERMEAKDLGGRSRWPVVALLCFRVTWWWWTTTVRF